MLDNISGNHTFTSDFHLNGDLAIGSDSGTFTVNGDYTNTFNYNLNFVGNGNIIVNGSINGGVFTTGQLNAFYYKALPSYSNICWQAG